MMRFKISLAIVLFLIFVAVTGAISVRRSFKGSNDFDTFYTAGHSVLTGQGVYYTGEYYQADENQSPFLYSPFAACLFALVAWLPMGPAAFLWNALNILLFVACAGLIMGMVGFKWQDLPAQWRRLSWTDRILVSGMSLVLWVDNLTMAQADILVFFLAVAGLAALQKGRSWFGGVVLAASIMIKMTPALFIIYLIAKKNGKGLAGVALGIFLFTLVIPSLIFGHETNRIYHRQWLGRTVKPLMASTVALFHREAAHPRKKSAELIDHSYLSNLLIEKNQSLAGMLTRLFLKARPAYGHTAEPIYAARRYEKMPVLVPVPRALLSVLILLIKLGMVAVLFDLSRRKGPADRLGQTAAFDTALFFIAMPLLSPLARSHQFVVFSFAYFLFFLQKNKAGNQALGKYSGGVMLATALYFLQALPYGKAAGFGAWAGLCLWLTFVFYLYGTPKNSAWIQSTHEKSIPISS